MRVRLKRQPPNRDLGVERSQSSEWREYATHREIEKDHLAIDMFEIGGRQDPTPSSKPPSKQLGGIDYQWSKVAEVGGILQSVNPPFLT